MRYLGEDVGYFVRTSPYRALAKPAPAAAFLRRKVEAGEECKLALSGYPAVRAEPLDFFYSCLRSLGALDQAFFEGLLFEQTWRGVVWGAWLAMLAPAEAFAAPLRAVGPRCPENEWLVDCAVRTIEGRAPAPVHGPVAELAARCRRLLEGIPRPVVRLRLAPSGAEVARMALEREQIASVYARSGAEAARRCLQGTLVAFYAQDHVRWTRSLAPLPATTDLAGSGGR